MNLLPAKTIAMSLIALIIVGVFAIPSQANAGWGDLLGTFGIGNSATSSNGYNSQSYDYNSTSSQSNGDIKISKEVKEINVDDSYHDRIEVRSGALVEVWIEVKNTSSKYSAATVVRDEIGGSTVYVKDSLRVNGQPSQPGLTSGGLRINIPSKGKATITYRMYVCGGSTYTMRANAYAPGVGAATDAIIIATENYNIGYSDETYTCIAQFQNNSSVSNNNIAVVNTTAGNPFGDWTGVNNSNSSTGTSSTSANLTNNNPFAGWTGVNNSNSTDTSTSNNAFGDWYGSSSTNSGNVFGDWTGVQSSNSQYNASSYSAETSSSSNSDSESNNRITYTADNYNSSSNPVASESSSPTYFVAPTTGVNKAAPFVFAGLLTLGFLAFRTRRLIFN